MSKKRADSYKDGVVIGGKSKKTNIFVLKMIIVVVLLICVSAFILFFTFNKSSSGQDGPTKEQLDIAKIEDLAATDLEEAKRQYQKYANQQTSNKEKATYLRGKGNLCLSRKDYECAVESYESADKLVEGSYQSTYSKGNAYEQLGDNKRAKESYEKVRVFIENIPEEELWFDKNQLDSDIQRVSQ